MKKPRTEKLYLNKIEGEPGKGETDWDRLRRMTDEDIRKAAKKDPRGRIDIDWSDAVIVEPVVKRHVSIRLDSDVIDFFKEGGRGYQSRINQVLRSFMEHQKKAG